mgnify:FL=1
MFDFFFHGFSGFDLAMLIVSAVLIGINKTGIPGLGLVPVLLLTLVFPTRLSTGLQLVMLCIADVAAVAWYRRSANWKLILRLIPAAAVGLGLGMIVVDQLDDAAMAKTIGAIVLFLCFISIARDRFLKNRNAILSHWAFGSSAGLLAGFTTLIANAAGPVTSLYFLALKLDKKEYVGTGAWFFLLMNWIKLPLFVLQDRITWQSFKADLAMIPFILAGAVLGIITLKHISQEWFNKLVLLFSILAGCKLLFW